MPASIEKTPIGRIQTQSDVVCGVDVSPVEAGGSAVVESRDIYEALRGLSCDVKTLIDGLN